MLQMCLTTNICQQMNKDQEGVLISLSNADCATTENKTLDLLYINVEEAFHTCTLLPLVRSDHKLVFLQTASNPVY